jgi:lipopolysaccharide biosynthesis glycosyltransferase
VAAIVLAADAKYVPYAMCTVASLGQHGAAADGVILLFPPGLEQSSLDVLQAVGRAHGVDVSAVALDAVGELETKGHVNARGHVSAFTYSKLFMAEALPDVDEVLYLDVDTLIRDSLDPLLRMELTHPIGAVRELGDNGVPLFGSTHVPYFNAGVLRMSLRRLREENLALRSIEVLRELPSLPFQDQDVLNLIFRDRHDALPQAFNMFDTYTRHALSAWEMLKDPAIVHFVGPAKPWHSDTRTRFAREWRTLHADLLGLKGTRRSDYISSGVSTWQEFVHEGLVRARYSRAGVRVRSALPVSIKHGMNQAVLSLVPRRSKLKTQVIQALQYGHALDPAEMAKLPASEQAAGRSSSRNHARTSDRVVELHAAEARRTEGNLLLVISAARSGTNALNSILRSHLVDGRVEGEFYGGFMPPTTLHHLATEYPWLKVPPGQTRPGAAGREAALKAWRANMSSVAVEITEKLLQRGPGVTAIKVFEPQLDPASLEEVMAVFRPRVMVLRRQMLFTFVSLLKAMSSDNFHGVDSTEVTFELTDAAAQRYADRQDRWFEWVYAALERQSIRPLDLSYADLYENGSAESRLVPFLSDLGFRREVGPREGIKPSTIRQDRRTDESVSRLIDQVSALKPATVSRLLRLPGPTPR